MVRGKRRHTEEQANPPKKKNKERKSKLKDTPRLADESPTHPVQENSRAICGIFVIEKGPRNRGNIFGGFRILKYVVGQETV